MSDIVSIIQARQRSLLMQWVHNPLVQVIVESPSALQHIQYLDINKSEAKMARVGRRSDSSCIMVRGGNNRDSTWSVWVAAGYKDYRNAYRSFIQAAYGLSVAKEDLSGYDVDHLLNKARAPHSTDLVRIEAIPSMANQKWGSTFEKASSDPRFTANTVRQRRTMSWMICAKLAGQLPPSGPEDLSGIERLVKFFGHHGINSQEARIGIDSMIRTAYKFRS